MHQKKLWIEKLNLPFDQKKQPNQARLKRTAENRKDT